MRNIILERERHTDWVKKCSGIVFPNFFAMGGYALYVWGSFGATALVMLCESLLIRSQRRQIVRNLRNGA